MFKCHADIFNYLFTYLIYLQIQEHKFTFIAF